jgi:hypothetical protein
LVTLAPFAAAAFGWSKSQASLESFTSMVWTRAGSKSSPAEEGAMALAADPGREKTASKAQTNKVWKMRRIGSLHPARSDGREKT